MILNKPNLSGGDDKVMTTVLQCVLYSVYSCFYGLVRTRHDMLEIKSVKGCTVCVCQMPGLPPMPPMPSMPLPPGMNMMQAMNMMGGPPPIHMGMEPPGMMPHDDRAAQVRDTELCVKPFASCSCGR